MKKFSEKGSNKDKYSNKNINELNNMVVKAYSSEN